MRFFNTVGPRQVGHYGMVLPNFARQALRGEPLTVYGDGAQTRCFGHVRDAVEGVLRLLGTPAAQGQVFNVGSVGEVTILQLAELVKARANSASEIQFVSYDEAYDEGFEDMRRRVPDVEKLARFTGFRFETSLETIVDDVLEEQRQKIVPRLSRAVRLSPASSVVTAVVERELDGRSTRFHEAGDAARTRQAAGGRSGGNAGTPRDSRASSEN